MQLANHEDIPVNQTKLRAGTCNQHKAREYMYKQVMIGVGFTSSDQLSASCRWQSIFKPNAY